MKKIALTILSFLTLQAFSQMQITHMWTAPAPSTGDDATRSVGVDGLYNTYDAGYFSGTADLDRTIAGTDNRTSNGGTDIYIRKNNEFGYLLWAITIGGSQDDACMDIQVRSNGDLVATGYFHGTVDFDPGSGTVNLNGGTSGAVFIAQYNSSGSLIWAKQLSAGTARNEGKSIARDANGNIVVAGVMRDNMDCDPGPGVTTLNLGGGLNQAFVVKLDSSGNFVWGKGFSGSGGSIAYGVDVNTAGDVYFTGGYNGTVDVNGDASVDNRTAVGSGTNDIFVEKILANGNFSWCATAGNTAEDMAYGIAVNASDELFITGGYRGTVDFDPGSGTSNVTAFGSTTDIFYWRLTNAGAFTYIYSFYGGGGDDIGYDIDAVGTSVTICGTFVGSVDFDPSGATQLRTAVGMADAFMVRLTSYTGFNYCGNIGGGNNELACSVVQGANNNMYIGGEFGSNPCDFNPGLTATANIASLSNKDGFLTKWNHCTSTPGPTSLITGPSPVCAGSTPTYSVTVVQGISYTWGLPATWSGVNGTNVITPTAGTSGGTITCAATNACGTSPSQARTVQVVTAAPGTPSAISGPTTPCEGSTQTYSVTAVAGVTYNWTLPGGWTGSSTTNSISVVVGNTSGTITVTANNVCGSSATVSLNVNPNLVPVAPATVSGSSTVCSGSTVTYTASTVPNALSYIWTLPSGWSGSSTTNSINATASANSGTITVSAGNACGLSPVTSFTVTALTIPSAPTSVAGSGNVCVGSTSTYSVTLVPGATSYVWTLPAGWSGTSSSNSISATAGASGGTITVAAVNQCGTSNTTSFNVITTSAPSATSVSSGLGTVCEGTTNTYTCSSVPTATSYIWTLPATWSGSSTTTSISATAGSQSGNITVSATNACGSSTPTTFFVNATAIPNAPATITGNPTVCDGTTTTFTAATSAGATSYNWNLPAGWFGTSTTNTIAATAGSTGGNITVSAANACGTSATTTFSVTVTTAPTAPTAITGTNTLCENATVTYTVNSDPNATSYTWTLPATWSGLSNADTISATAGSGGGTIFVTADNACGSSPSTVLSVTVTPAPFITSVTEDSICDGTSATLLAAANSGTISWYTSSSGGTPINSGSTFTTSSLNATTTYYVQVEENGCFSTFDPITAFVTVIDTGITLAGNVLTSDQAGADSYQWLDCNNGNQPIAGATTQSLTLSMNGTYAVVVSQNGCIDTSYCITTSVNVNENYNAAPISIHPNPAIDHIMISGVQQVQLIEVYDLSGRLLITDQNVNSISISTLPAAMYHIRITTSSGASNHRLQKM